MPKDSWIRPYDAIDVQKTRKIFIEFIYRNLKFHLKYPNIIVIIINITLQPNSNRKTNFFIIQYGTIIYF